MNGPIFAEISKRIETTFTPARYELVDESHLHSAPRGAESHFKLVVVADAFAGKSRVARQREVYSSLHPLMETVHALTLFTYSPEEWERLKPNPQSPKCSHST